MEHKKDGLGARLFASTIQEFAKFECEELSRVCVIVWIIAIIIWSVAQSSTN